MTLSSQVNRANYTADGNQATKYAIPFWYNGDETWIEVYVDDVLDLTSHYTVDTINDEVQFNVGEVPTAGSNITVARAVPLDQQTDYTAFGKFPAESHEQALDKIVAIAQQLNDGVERTVKAPVSTPTGSEFTFPNPTDNRTIKFRDNGDGTFSLTVSTKDPDQAQTAAEAAQTAAEAAQTAAETAESGAQTAESGAVAAQTASETARDKAQDWADKAEDVEVETGKFSARHWSEKAKQFIPIGMPFPVSDDIPGCPVPDNSGTVKYIKLTAGEDGVGQYNEGLLTGESVSGSSPTITATAVISHAASPMDGQTVHLLNTENRYLMPGESPGTVANDQMQGHWHLLKADAGLSAGSTNYRAGSGNYQAASDAVGDARADGVNGTPRTGDHTNVKHMQATYYMRIA